METYWKRFDRRLELHLTGREETLSKRAREALICIRREGHDPPIRFLGTPDDQTLARQYASATALLMLSRAEGFGLPVLEAMSHGCPVIAARTSALPEVVGNAGLLVEPHHAEGVAEAIHIIKSCPQEAERFAGLGRLRAASFSWDRSIDAYHALYLKAVGQAASSVADSSHPVTFPSPAILQ